MDAIKSTVETEFKELKERLSISLEKWERDSLTFPVLPDSFTRGAFLAERRARDTEKLRRNEIYTYISSDGRFNRLKIRIEESRIRLESGSLQKHKNELLEKKKLVIHPLSESFLLRVPEILDSIRLKEERPHYALLSLLSESDEPFSERARKMERYEGKIGFVWGPPGTGKTYEIIKKAEKEARRRKSVLIACNNNESINNIYESLVKSGIKAYLYERRVPLEKIEGVLCTTISKALMDYPDFFSLIEPRFDYVLIDEAGIVRLDSFLYISFMAKKGFFIYGDHKQLAPVERVADESPMIYDRLGISSMGDNEENCLLKMLRKEYRMCRTLTAFISETFYSGRLIYSTSLSGRRRERDKMTEKIFPSPLSSLDLSPFNCLEYREDGSKMNFISAFFSFMTAMHYARTFEGAEIALITPYIAEKRLLETFLSAEKEVKNRIMIDTVHAFQGKEADFVIFDIPDSTDTDGKESLSLLLSHYLPNRNGDSDRLINVAVSRARLGFVLVANLSFLRRNSKARYESLNALLDITENSDNEKRLRSFINMLNSEFEEMVSIGLPGKTGEKSRNNDSSTSAWALRREFWMDKSSGRLKCFIPRALSEEMREALKRDIRRYGRNASLYQSTTKESKRDRTLFPMLICDKKLIFGAIRESKTVEEKAEPFIIIKNDTARKIRSEFFKNYRKKSEKTTAR